MWPAVPGFARVNVFLQMIQLLSHPSVSLRSKAGPVVYLITGANTSGECECRTQATEGRMRDSLRYLTHSHENAQIYHWALNGNVFKLKVLLALILTVLVFIHLVNLLEPFFVNTHTIQ
jgi:hypothetical protein